MYHDYIVPSYQREFTWEEARKWRFIESILIGLPIPFIFFREDPKSGHLEIVDGSQRLRTIEEFLHDELKLGALEKLPTLKSFKFSDLPESRQRKIKNRPIRGIILKEHTDAEARFDLLTKEKPLPLVVVRVQRLYQLNFFRALFGSYYLE